MKTAPKKKKEESKQEEVETNGKGVGLYYDSKLKRYILVTLDLTPENDSAKIVTRKTLGDSKLSAGLQANVLLEQLINKLK
jgi:adenylosuccinate synthase